MNKTVSRTPIRDVSERRASAPKLRHAALPPIIIALGLVLLLASFACAQRKVTGRGDNASQPGTGVNPKELRPIDATNTNPRMFSVYQLSFDNIDRYEAPLNVESDNDRSDRWRAIKFEQIPAGISLRVDEQPEGYLRGEVINPNTWYSFKKKLPLIITVQKTVQLPAEVGYKLSFIKVPEGGLTPERARELIKSEENIEEPFPAQRIKFQDINPTPSPTPSPTATPTPVTGKKEEPFIPLWLWILFGLVLLAMGVILWMARRRDADRDRTYEESKRGGGRKASETPLDGYDVTSSKGSGSDPGSRVKALKVKEKPSLWEKLFGILRRKPSTSTEDIPLIGETNPEEARTPEKEEAKRQEEGASASPAKVVEELAAVSEIPHKVTDSTLGAAEQWTVPDQTLPRPKVDPTRESQGLEHKTTVRLDDIEDKLSKLILTVSNQNSVSRVEALNTDLAAQKTLIGELQRTLGQLRSDLEIVINEVARHEAQNTQTQQGLENAQQYMQAQVRHFQETVAQLTHDSMQREAQQQDFYAGKLGDLLGISVESLREANFAQLVEEASRNLDRFFQQHLPNADGLPELHRKAQAISAALEQTVGNARQIKPGMEKLEPYVERAKALAHELGEVSGQLNSKAQGFRTTLTVPVAKYEGGREGFLEELGKAVRREMEKLRDPQQHWSKELERLATSEIVAVTDICDIEVTGRPGGDKELERSLSELFREAGLRAIVPEVGEPFRPSEQHLTQMFAGSASDSQKIKKVQVRGFYYMANGKERLLRKAKVEVYR